MAAGKALTIGPFSRPRAWLGVAFLLAAAAAAALWLGRGHWRDATADREARWQRAHVAVAQNQLEDAYLQFHAYAELYPGEARGWLAVARLLQSGGLVAEAEDLTTRAVYADPADVESRLLRASLRLRLGRLHGTRVDARVAGAYPAAQALLKDAEARIAAASPRPDLQRVHAEARRRDDADSLMIWPGDLGMVRRNLDERLQQQDFAAARGIAQSARRVHPATLYGPWLDGLVSLAEGQPEAAERYFREGLTIAPRSALLARALAQVWAQRAGATHAAEQLAALATADPGFAYARQLAARHFIAARQPDRAETLLQQAAAAPGADAAAARDLCAFYLEHDRGGEAATACTEGLGRFAGDVALRHLMARVRLRQEDRAGAAQLYDSILVDWPDDRVAAAELAMLLADGGEVTRAQQLTTNLAVDAPADAASLAAIGWVQLRAGDADSAMPWLEAAALAAPGEPLHRYHLGAAYAAAGESQRARALLQAAIDAPGHFVQRLEAQRLLRELSAR